MVRCCGGKQLDIGAPSCSALGIEKRMRCSPKTAKEFRLALEGLLLALFHDLLRCGAQVLSRCAHASHLNAQGRVERGSARDRGRLRRGKSAIACRSICDRPPLCTKTARRQRRAEGHARVRAAGRIAADA